VGCNTVFKGEMKSIKQNRWKASGLNQSEGLPPGYRALASGIVLSALHDLAAPAASPERWASGLLFLCDPWGADAICEELGHPQNILGAWSVDKPEIRKNVFDLFEESKNGRSRTRKSVSGKAAGV
jgi:hypothetical protein